MRIMICLIDDDKFYQVFTKKLLVTMPEKVKEVLQFYDAKSALDYMQKNIANEDRIPDVIFLDLNLPDLSGWNFLKKLKTIGLKKHPVIHICSSSVSPEDVEKATEEILVNEYIVKPVNRERIQELLREYFAYAAN